MSSSTGVKDVPTSAFVLDFQHSVDWVMTTSLGFSFFVQAASSNAILFYRYTHQLSRSCCINSWASPNPSKCKIEHHTLLLTLLYNCSPVRSHPNLYPNYWEYFIATEIMLRLTTIHFSVQTYLLLSNNS